jgi:hypothetical protein
MAQPEIYALGKSAETSWEMEVFSQKDKKMNFTNWVIQRLGEPSTWRGIIATVTAAGLAIEPEQAAAITATGLAVIGAVNVFKKDEKNR